MAEAAGSEFQAIYVARPDRAGGVDEIVQALRASGCRGTLTDFDQTPWLSLVPTLTVSELPTPLSTGWFEAQLAQHHERWNAFRALGILLSREVNGDALGIEGRPAAKWVRFSRWSRGTELRCFEFAAESGQNGGFTEHIGTAEAWEGECEEVGTDLPGLALLLSLPGIAGAPSPHATGQAHEL